MSNLLIMVGLVIMSNCGDIKTGKMLGFDGIQNALFEVNVITGEASFLHSYEDDVGGTSMTVSPDGTLYASSFGEQLVILDPSSEELHVVGTFGVGYVAGLAFAVDGTLYGYDGISNELVTVDLQSGEATVIGFVIDTIGTGLAFSDAGTLYLIGNPVGGPRLYVVDPSTGSGQETGPLGNGFTFATELEPIGEVMYASAHDSLDEPYDVLVIVDTSTGLATKIGGYGSTKDGPYMHGLAFLPGAGDGDRDGDVDGDDVAFFEGCFGELDEPGKSPYCAFLDSDKDGDIDCDDWEAFIPNWTEDTDPPAFPLCDCENPPCDGPCEGDANGDGLVDPLDAGYVSARFGCAVGSGDPACDAADVNLDGLVDPLDVGFVLARFGVCER